MAPEARLNETPAAGSRISGWWHRVRPVLAVALLVVAVSVGWDHRTELRDGLHRLDHPAWPWLLAACAIQASSMVVFARLQRWLLRCGGVDVRLLDMVEITLAGNALSTSIPGGAAWAAGWIWGQLRRRSVDRVLAGWVVLVAGALSSFALFLLVVVGAELAGSHGPVASLRWLDRALVVLGVLAVGAVVAIVRSSKLRARWAGHLARVGDRTGLGPKAVRGLDHLSHQVRIVTPSPTAWLEALLLALANWGADLATLVFCIWTVHASVPWRGIVIAYALTQISASIPITPGGLAVVEASLGALLVAYGMASTTAVTVVLLYRLISFWCLVPIGWASWGLLELAQRRGGRRRHPWAFHRHDDAVDPSAAEVREHQGPERILAPQDCVGCDDTSGSGRSARVTSSGRH
jgi:uncharacterized protein (TIRG00374 family)